MDPVHKFLDQLPEAVRPIPQASLDKRHDNHFLRLAELSWGRNGPSILRDLADEKKQLCRAAEGVADAVLESLIRIRAEFVADLERVLDANCPDTAPHHVVGSPLGEAIVVWIEGRKAAVDSFRSNPLALPAWLAIGISGRLGAGYEGTTAEQAFGIWEASRAPWREWTDSRGFEADEYWAGLIARSLPNRQINDYIRRQAASPWTAAHILDGLLGPAWEQIAAERSSAEADAEAGQWFAQMLPGYAAWCGGSTLAGDTSMPWTVGPAPRGRTTQRAYQQFHQFRVAGVDLAHGDADPYALMVAYCLDQLVDEQPGSVEDLEYRPAAWFVERKFPGARLRKAASPGRKSKAVRKTGSGPSVMYSAVDVKKHWPGSLREPG